MYYSSTSGLKDPQNLWYALQTYCETTEPTFVSNIPVFLRLAEQRIYNALNLPSTRAQAVLPVTTGNPYVSLPIDWIFTYSVAIEQCKTLVREYHGASQAEGTEVPPAGYNAVLVEVYGGGGSGAGAGPTGGGGGGYSAATTPIKPGDFYYYYAGAGGAASNIATGNNGDFSYVTTYFGAPDPLYIQANGGGGAAPLTTGLGGTAFGGDVNSTGGDGIPSAGGQGAGAQGGAGGIQGYNSGSGEVAPTDGSPYGGGGGSSLNLGTYSGAGGEGLVRFTYTDTTHTLFLGYLLDKDQNFIRESFPDTTYEALPQYYAQEVPATLSGDASFIALEVGNIQPPCSIVDAGEIELEDEQGQILLEGSQITETIQQIILGPTPDMHYRLKIEYMSYGPSVVNAGNTWLSTNFETVLLYGAIREGYIYLKGEQDLIAAYEARYQESLAETKMLADGKNRQDTYRSGQVRLKVT